MADSTNQTESGRNPDYKQGSLSLPGAVAMGTGVMIGAGIFASTFAVSRMLAMLTNMGLVPHRHFGMPGDIQKHTLVYTIVLAMLLTIFFDLSRIAAMGAIFYVIMDIAIHWGILRHLRKNIGANPVVLISAILLDVVVLVALGIVKFQSDPFVVYFSLAGLIAIFAGERVFLTWTDKE